MEGKCQVCSWKQLISSYCLSLGLTINEFSIPDILSLMYLQVNQIKMCSWIMNNQAQSKYSKNRDTDLDNESLVYSLRENAEKGQMKGVSEKRQ